jgi:UDP-2,3-diacylglucosamine hydrolase
LNNSEPYYFISDLHFGFKSYNEERKHIKLFEVLCDQIISSKGNLVILGDLFDYWFDYKTVVQKNSHRILTKIEDISDAGLKIYYLCGNHDFVHMGYFLSSFNVTISDDSLILNINNKKFFLAHGDGLIKNDKGYNILKKVVRNKLLQKVYSKIHPSIGIKLASKFSQTSRHYNDGKNFGTIDGLFEFAKHKIDEGFDFVLFGHSHQKKFEKYDGGYYINLGTWLRQPCYGLYFNDEFKIIDLIYG